MVEVLIVGAGPAGSAAAIHLARAGREVLVVDRCRFPRGKACGEYYNPECSRLLRELGLLPQVLDAGARHVTSVVLGAPGGCTLRVPFAEFAPPEDGALSLGRETLDTLLVEAARDAGAEVWEGATVREPLTDAGRVVGAVVRIDGVDREVRARVTLAADGLRSRFARRLGVALGDGGRRKFGVTARYRALEAAPETVAMQASAAGCCGLVVRGREANLGMVVDESRVKQMGGDPADFFQRELARYPELRRWLEPSTASTLTVGPLTWLTRRQAVAGCLLLGDAAGFYDPFTGQGVTFALLTAALAARVAQEALSEDDVSRRRLAEYERCRRALLGPRILVQKAIQEVISRPRILERVVERLERRPHVAHTLMGVIADVLPPSRVFSPAFLARLLL